MTITTHYDGRVFVPDSPVDLPVGYMVRFKLDRSADAEPDQSTSSLAKLAEIAKQFPPNPDLPTDFAAQHDHYLHGARKR